MKPYLHCRNHRKTGGTQCDNTSYIRYEVLEELVLNEINKIIEKYYNLEKLEKNYSSKKSSIDYDKDMKILEKEKNDIEKKLNKTSDRFTMLYDDKADGIITTTEFVMFINAVVPAICNAENFILTVSIPFSIPPKVILPIAFLTESRPFVESDILNFLSSSFIVLILVLAFFSNCLLSNRISTIL